MRLLQESIKNQEAVLGSTAPLYIERLNSHERILSHFHRRGTVQNWNGSRRVLEFSDEESTSVSPTWRSRYRRVCWVCHEATSWVSSWLPKDRKYSREKNKKGPSILRRTMNTLERSVTSSSHLRSSCLLFHIIQHHRDLSMLHGCLPA